MSCDNCQKKALKSKLKQAFKDAEEWAIKHGVKEVAILERANQTGYIFAKDGDERLQRLKLICYYSID